jgi:hypothetical protein
VKLRSLAARSFYLPANLLRAYRLPKDTGAGHVLRWEDDAWAIRPATGWRSWRWPSRPLAVNRDLGRDDEDAAADWALTALDS